MANGVKKKKNRKLRRQIRKTFGALLMISAIVVATLPTTDVSADPIDTAIPKVAVTDDHTPEPLQSAQYTYDSTIPYCQDRTDTSEKIVYTSGDGTFQFVYMRPTTSTPNKVAVILGYNSGVLMESSLTIPDTLEAYKKFTDNTTREGYCLVSRNDSFLFYESTAQKKDSNGFLLYLVPALKDPVDNTKTLEINQYNTNLVLNTDGTRSYIQREPTGEVDDNGDPIYEDVAYAVTESMETVYYPCYYDQRSTWATFDDAELYYKDTSDNYVKAGDDSNYWKINAEVAYIGGEKIEDNGSGGWTVNGFIENPSEGVFAGQNNITNLSVGSNVLGISDYAFAGCSTLSSVTLANGLKSVGNGAFANCIRLQSCSIASNANIQAIGKDAFFNCQTLSSFTSPIGLRALGDNCFEGCTNLTTVDLCAGGGAVALERLGNNLFKGCSSLTALTFPDSYAESDLPIKMLDGCSSLQYVKVPNANTTFVESSETSTDFAIFKNTVPSSFYFEGPDSDPNAATTTRSMIHVTANDEEIAFKYNGQEVYEVVIKETDDDKIIYQVNNNNELIKVLIVGEPLNVVIPKVIGPYGVSGIGAGSFNDICSIESVDIPATVTTIGDNAFKGCHKLTKVIYDAPENITSIGTDAFRTQVVTCAHRSEVSSNKTPKLQFVGAMMNASGQDTVPFSYAMTEANQINNPEQNHSWITCHSGFPTNMEVTYSYDYTTSEGGSQLQSYPRYDTYSDDTKLAAWVLTLPYVDATKDVQDPDFPNDPSKTVKQDVYYQKIIKTAVTKYNANDPNDPPTEEQLNIINAALNIAVPTNVDSLKPGLFSGYKADSDGLNPEAISGLQADAMIKTIVLNGVDEIEPFTFTGCNSLKEVSIVGADTIDDYAFGCNEAFNTSTGKMDKSLSCLSLNRVVLGSNITDIGKRPFRGCDNLTEIECLGDNLSYADGILFDQTNGGKDLIECLSGRGESVGSYTVKKEELAGVTGLNEEAFMDCNGIGQIDLADSEIEEIPINCFNNCDQLNSVVLPDTAASIEKDAFINDPLLKVVTIPNSVSIIEKEAFVTKPTQQKLTFQCVEGSAADRYAKNSSNSSYITAEYGVVTIKHTVYFWDYPDYPDVTSKALFNKQKVSDKGTAVPPSPAPEHEGYTFTGWSDYSNITRDTDIYPSFSDEAYKITFMDWDATLITQDGYINPQTVERGKSATKPPIDPKREGYTFTGWTPDYNNVQKELTIIAQYKNNSDDDSKHTVIFYAYKDGAMQAISTQYIEDGKAATEPATPARSGYTFIGWAPTDFTKVTKDMTIVASYEKTNPNPNPTSAPKKTSTPAPTATPTNGTNGDNAKKYTVSVTGGSGSGSYVAGAVVPLNAYAMGEGQSFDKWTSSTAGVGFANPNATSTTFTMPANNVAITATYKTGNGTSTNGNATNNNSSGGSSKNQNNNSGTTVEVTKPDISNKNLAGATVSGSTDDFVIKVTEDQSASDAVVAALQAKYGDISKIKYSAMDISMYDSTGRTKIADTSGMAVDLTLPIPNDLIQYAGNNKVGAVVNGTLEELDCKNNMVDDILCTKFRATHFSPYVIYVDTANLVEGTVDASPKTGDPIHPKWFLATGLACIALIMFFKRDKVLIKTKTA